MDEEENLEAQVPIKEEYASRLPFKALPSRPVTAIILSYVDRRPYIC